MNEKILERLNSIILWQSRIYNDLNELSILEIPGLDTNQIQSQTQRDYVQALVNTTITAQSNELLIANTKTFLGQLATDQTLSDIQKDTIIAALTVIIEKSSAIVVKEDALEEIIG